MDGTSPTEQKKCAIEIKATCGRFLFQFNGLNMTNVTARYSALTFYQQFHSISFAFASSIDSDCNLRIYAVSFRVIWRKIVLKKLN